MWFRNVFLKTLRDCRVAILGWGLGLGALAPIIFAGVPILLGSSPASAGEVLALTRNPAVRLFAEPVDVLSPGGYATWRLSMVLPILAIWALLAVSRTCAAKRSRRARPAPVRPGIAAADRRRRSSRRSPRRWC